MSILESIYSRLRPKEQFPSKEVFPDIREQYRAERSAQYLKSLTDDPDFVAYVEWKTESSFAVSQEEVVKLSSCLADFEFGLSLVHRKTGRPLVRNDLTLSADTVAPDHDAFLYVSKNAEIEEKYRGKYLCQLKKAFDLVSSPEALEKIRHHWQIPNLTVEDLFLLGGIEEAAHKEYDHKKNKNEQIVEARNSEEYHITDMEFRALIWKVNIVLRYFPEYVEAFKSFLKKKRQRRQEHLQVEF